MPSFALLNPAQHNRADFNCSEQPLNKYLREQAMQHHREGISTTHVLVDESAPESIIGYYTLAAARMLLSGLHPGDQKRLPRYPVPAVRMARLAVALTEQGKGHGATLLAHAVVRSLGLREHLGVHVMLVDAINDRAAEFYRGYGFRPTASLGRTLYLPLGRT
jgi:ribosomal protein S18 acetylase RimI-like enzyme